MKLFRTLVIGMMFVVIHNVSTTVLQTDISGLIGSVNPDAGKAFSLIANQGSNWTNISNTISNALNHTAR